MIKVNGRDFEWEQDMTVEVLLGKKGYIFPKIIVKINGELIKKEDYDTKAIRDEDNVQVIHLLAGG